MQVSTIERRFDLTSQWTSVYTIMYDVGVGVGQIPMCYFASRGITIVLRHVTVDDRLHTASSTVA